MQFEKFFEEKLKIPIKEGLGETFEKQFSIFERVKNNVAFVNPEVNIPLKLKIGKESPLGLFLKIAFPEKSYIEKFGEKKLEIRPDHLRSVLLGRIIFNDKEGRLYRDIDLKGIGFLPKKFMDVDLRGNKGLGDRLYGIGEYFGLLKSENAFLDHEITEKLLKAGIRVPRVLSIINLEELIIEGEKISLNDVKKKGIIEEEYQPVIEVRGFGTKERVSFASDIFPPMAYPFLDSDSVFLKNSQEKKRLILEDAKKLVSQETGKDLSDNEKYLEWFSQTLGKNLGLLHKIGLIHTNLIAHNLTLDCRLVDFVTMKKITPEGTEKDILLAKLSLYQFFIFLSQIDELKLNFSKLEKLFKEDYDLNNS